MIRQTAAELFASTLLEVFPKLQLIEVRATPFGFFIDFCCPFPIEEAQLELVSERVRAKMKKGIEIRQLEMTTRNAIEYMKHVKQYFRERAIDQDEPFTNVVQIDDYANIAYGDVVVGPLPQMVFSVEGVESAGEVKLHGKRVDVQRIVGYAEEDKEALKEVKRFAKKFEGTEELDFAVFSEGSYCWMGEGLAAHKKIEKEVKKILLDFGLSEIMIVGDASRGEFGQKVFENCVVSTDGHGEFGVKDAPMQGAICGTVKKELNTYNSLLQLLGKLGRISPQKSPRLENKDFIVKIDPFGIDWIVAEIEEKIGEIEFIVWLDRLVALSRI